MESEDFVFVRVRKSTRLKSSPQKRQFDNLGGFTSPSKRKRKSSKSATSAKKDTTVKTSAAVNEFGADVDTEVGALTAVDGHGIDAAAEDIAVDTPIAVDGRHTDVAAENAGVDTVTAVDGHGTDKVPKDTSADTPIAFLRHGIDAAAEDTAVDTPICVDGHGTDAAPEDPSVGTPSGYVESVSNEVMTDSLQSSSESTPRRPWTPGSITGTSNPESVFTAESTQIGVQPNPLLSCPPPTIADLLNPEHAIRVATSVLLELVNRHDKIGHFGNRTGTATTTTNTAKIRTFTKELASLDYEAAVRSIGERKAMHVGNRIQIDNDENAYWEIILKDVKVPDPATSREATSKGPLDGFSAAEKVATLNFMKRANFKGKSPENQRQCRCF